ncbi:hypothetical protein N1031_07350 [Herbiconiux moechotypicola]|uniref:Lipoprotein n=1 Tax=Herbiconiux moechotypicola TaxID=637393 RepID=A0ABN3DGZ7_9MICO|nr:hypothetical protein [Herbiconiux moechotypicola]MCS5729573.1 hypothetical protein [Herbiconiux moechotypicola]
MQILRPIRVAAAALVTVGVTVLGGCAEVPDSLADESLTPVVESPTVATPQPVSDDLESTCGEVSRALSGYFNADDGYSRGELTADEWIAEVHASTAVLELLLEKDSSVEVGALVGGARLIPEDPSPGFVATNSSSYPAGPIVEACEENGTPIDITRRYPAEPR